MEGNTSSLDPGFKESLSFKVFKISLYSLILMLCLIGNSMVVLIVCRTKRMRMPSNLLILNLAICDLITPITSIPFDLALEENDYVWPFGRVLCKTLWPLATLSATAASLTLALISLDRYRVIMHPFKQRLSSKQVKIFIAFTHLLGFLFVLPYVYYLDLSTETNPCEEKWPVFSYRQAYTLFLFIVQYGIPLGFMTVMYSITLLNLRASTNKFENLVRDNRHQKISLQVDPDNMNGSRLDLTRDCRKASRETLGHRHDQIGRDQNIRATKMFVTVVIVFATCRLPNEIFWLWSDFGEGHASENSNIAGIICRMFTYTNSIFNPVIYWTFSKAFKKGFKEIFRTLWRRNGNDIWDDELGEDEKRYPRLSTISDSISFAWRKLSRSRSESSYHPTPRENQPSPVNNGGHDTSFRSPFSGVNGDTSEVSRKQGSITFDEPVNHSLMLLPVQSKLAKLSEESLSQVDEGVLDCNVRTRRCGTVQPPEKHAPIPCNTIITITRPLPETDPSFPICEDCDDEMSSTLLDIEKFQSPSEETCPPDIIKDIDEEKKEASVEKMDNGCTAQSEEQNRKHCGNAENATVIEAENPQTSSKGSLLCVQKNEMFGNKRESFENMDNEFPASAENNENHCDNAIKTILLAMENYEKTSQGAVDFLVESKDKFVDKDQGVENIENAEAWRTQAADIKEIENIFLKQPIVSLNQNGIKETVC